MRRKILEKIEYEVTQITNQHVLLDDYYIVDKKDLPHNIKIGDKIIETTYVIGDTIEVELKQKTKYLTNEVS